MCLCGAVAAVTAIGIGANSIFSIQSMSVTSYETYEEAVDEGYKTEIKSQVQSAISVIQSEYDEYLAGEKTEEEAMDTRRNLCVPCAIGMTRADISGSMHWTIHW